MALSIQRLKNTNCGPTFFRSRKESNYKHFNLVRALLSWGFMELVGQLQVIRLFLIFISVIVCLMLKRNYSHLSKLEKILTSKFIQNCWYINILYFFFVEISNWIICISIFLIVDKLNSPTLSIMYSFLFEWKRRKAIALKLLILTENHAPEFWLGHKWHEYYVAC